MRYAYFERFYDRTDINGDVQATSIRLLQARHDVQNVSNQCTCFCGFPFYRPTGWMFDKSGNYDGGYTFLGIVQALGVLALAIEHLCNQSG